MKSFNPFSSLTDQAFSAEAMVTIRRKGRLVRAVDLLASAVLLPMLFFSWRVVFAVLYIEE